MLKNNSQRPPPLLRRGGDQGCQLGNRKLSRDFKGSFEVACHDIFFLQLTSACLHIQGGLLQKVIIAERL
jgi:hypothetical protein